MIARFSANPLRPARPLAYPDPFAQDPADWREPLPALPPVPQAPRLPARRELATWTTAHHTADECREAHGLCCCPCHACRGAR